MSDSRNSEFSSPLSSTVSVTPDKRTNRSRRPWFRGSFWLFAAAAAVLIPWPTWQVRPRGGYGFVSCEGALDDLLIDTPSQCARRSSGLVVFAVALAAAGVTLAIRNQRLRAGRLDPATKWITLGVVGAIQLLFVAFFAAVVTNQSLLDVSVSGSFDWLPLPRGSTSVLLPLVLAGLLDLASGVAATRNPSRISGSPLAQRGVAAAFALMALGLAAAAVEFQTRPTTLWLSRVHLSVRVGGPVLAAAAIVACVTISLAFRRSRSDCRQPA